MTKEELQQKIDKIDISIDEFLKTMEDIKQEGNKILKQAILDSTNKKIKKVKEFINLTLK